VNEDTGGIRQYIAGLQTNIESVPTQQFCSNETVNLILSAFYARAEKSDVRLDIAADIPAATHVPNTDLCVIISNTLENAINAVSRVQALPRVIHFISETRNGQLFIEITNPCEEPVEFQDDLPVSNHHNGIGVKSILLSATSLGGLVKFELQNQQFSVKLIL
jgi:sensor histidine kinase regulating citrate/malate metabolism